MRRLVAVLELMEALAGDTAEADAGVRVVRKRGVGRLRRRFFIDRPPVPLADIVGTWS